MRLCGSSCMEFSRDHELQRTSSEARPCQQSCRDGLRISALTVCCESLDFVGFLRWRRTIYTLFISLDDRIGISKRVVIIQLDKKEYYTQN